MVVGVVEKFFSINLEQESVVAGLTLVLRLDHSQLVHQIQLLPLV